MEEPKYDDAVKEAAYQICLDITVRLAEAGYPPYRWSFGLGPFHLIITWSTGATVKYLIDESKTPEELTELIIDGELATEYISRPAPPSKRLMNKIRRAEKQKAKSHHPGFRRGKTPNKKKGTD